MLLDTNILIGYLNGDEGIIAAIDERKQHGFPLLISTITIAETLSFPALSSDEIARVREFLKGFVRVSFDERCAETAAEFRRAYRLTLTDAGIVATAHIHNVPLMTRNIQIRKVREVIFVDA